MLTTTSRTSDLTALLASAADILSSARSVSTRVPILVTVPVGSALGSWTLISVGDESWTVAAGGEVGCVCAGYGGQWLFPLTLRV
jgi:hypothetical protein